MLNFPFAQDSDDVWPAPTTGAIIIQTGEGENLGAGTGVVVICKVTGDDSMNAGILQVDEGIFENGSWKPGRRLNGDQIHQGRHLRIPEGTYGIQKLELYSYQ